MTAVSSKAGEAPHLVEISAIFCGADICVSICGGTHYHIGAVALGIPRPSLKDASKLSASVSVLCALGHKEDELARDAAHRLAVTFGCKVCACAGLHIDEASAEDIRVLWENYEQALADFGKKASELMAPRG